MKKKFMRYKFFISIGLLITTLACNNDDSQQAIINGAYTGIFERNGNSTIVTLNLNHGIFNGESETIKFPAICKGSYSISNNSIIFTNDCRWTAEFDWTLILNETWDYVLNNNTLILTKSNGDQYTLTRQ